MTIGKRRIARWGRKPEVSVLSLLMLMAVFPKGNDADAGSIISENVAGKNGFGSEGNYLFHYPDKPSTRAGRGAYSQLRDVGGGRASIPIAGDGTLTSTVVKGTAVPMYITLPYDVVIPYAELSNRVVDLKKKISMAAAMTIGNGVARNGQRAGDLYVGNKGGTCPNDIGAWGFTEAKTVFSGMWNRAL